MNEGTRWHVGNGFNISVFGYRWIPSPFKFKPICNPLIFGKDLMVSDSIDWTTRGWDNLIVAEVLPPYDARLVLQMKLRDPTIKDELLWHYSTNGEFSVKSAYHLWMERGRRSTQAESLDNFMTCKIWRKRRSTKV